MTRLFAAALVATAILGGAATAHAQFAPHNYPLITIMTGPTVATSGERLTYTLHYQLVQPTERSADSVSLVIPLNTTLVSSRLTSGIPTGRPEPSLDSDGRTIEWIVRGSPEQPAGTIDMVVQIDSSFVGLLGTGGCFKRGTEVDNPADDCHVHTQVYAPGTLPLTGGGPDNPVPAYATLLGLFGAMLLAAGWAVRASFPSPSGRGVRGEGR
jgi:hypothetical protein